MGSSTETEDSAAGHYLIVEDPALDGNSGFFCVQLQQLEWVPVVIIGGCVLIALINIVLWTILIKRKRAAKKAKQSEGSAEAERASGSSEKNSGSKKNRKKKSEEKETSEEKEPAESK